MDGPSSEENQGKNASATAFIYYHPKTGATKEQISYNAEAWRILSASAPASKGGTTSSLELSSLCARWMGLLDERLANLGGSGEGEASWVGFIDLYQSQRRRYGVRGIALSDHPSDPQKQKGPHLFILERISPGGLNLSAMFRHWNLNHREQEITRLLLSDKSNKEIAAILGLSINTMKGYLKLLMRRLGVGSRTGIIARLLTGRNPSS